MGVCVTQFDPQLFERGYVCSPGALSRIYAAVVSLNAIPYYKLPVTSKHKFHVTIGHDTIMASVHLFSPGEFGQCAISEYRDAELAMLALQLKMASFCLTMVNDLILPLHSICFIPTQSRPPILSRVVLTGIPCWNKFIPRNLAPEARFTPKPVFETES